MMRTPGSAPRRLRSIVLLFALAAVVCAIAIAAAAEILRIESVRSQEAPAVDGKLAEWSSPLVALGSAPLSLGVRNDGQFLYVALASSDQATRMMLGAAGFTMWMDPLAKNKKSFGITVPPTMARGGTRNARPGPGWSAAEQERSAAGLAGRAAAGETLIKVLKSAIIDPAIEKHNELRLIKAQKPKIKSAKDFLEKEME